MPVQINCTFTELEEAFRLWTIEDREGHTMPKEEADAMTDAQRANSCARALLGYLATVESAKQETP